MIMLRFCAVMSCVRLLVVLLLSPQAMTDGLPVPAALYPLNGRHGTSDISPNKNPRGIANDVHLAPGPYGHPQGWVNRENDQGPIFHYGLLGAGGFHFWIWEVSGNVNAYAKNRGWSSSTHAPMAPNTWYYVGITYDYSSGIAQVWLNGEAKSKVSVGISELTTQSDVRMGALQNDNHYGYFKGRVCCLQVYRNALSEQEIIAVQDRTLWFFNRDQSIFANFQPVIVAGKGDLVKRYKGCTVTECLLRCSRMTECKSAAFEGISIGRSSTGCCQLYRAPFKESLGDDVYFQDKKYYNIKKK